ncbi:cation channel sperm-associated protein subunit epsilon-like protein [Oculina patagonica]
MRPDVKNTFFIFLLNILLSCYDAFSGEIWRYSSKEGDGTLFTTRSSIVVEYLATNESVDWCYPTDCSLNNKSFNSAILHCPKPGFHAIGPITSSSHSQSARHISVLHSPFYYEWYLSYDRETTK